jgi:hypothetical protein
MQTSVQEATNGRMKECCEPTTNAILIGLYGNSRCSKQQGKQPNKDHPMMQ